MSVVLTGVPRYENAGNFFQAVGSYANGCTIANVKSQRTFRSMFEQSYTTTAIGYYIHIYDS